MEDHCFKNRKNTQFKGMRPCNFNHYSNWLWTTGWKKGQTREFDGVWKVTEVAATNQIKLLWKIHQHHTSRHDRWLRQNIFLLHFFGMVDRNWRGKKLFDIVRLKIRRLFNDDNEGDVVAFVPFHFLCFSLIVKAPDGRKTESENEAIRVCLWCICRLIGLLK